MSELKLLPQLDAGLINADFVRGLAEVKDMDQLRGLLSMLGSTAKATPDGAAAGMLKELSRGRLNDVVAELLDSGSPHLDIISVLNNIKNSFAVSAVIGK